MLNLCFRWRARSCPTLRTQRCGDPLGYLDFICQDEVMKSSLKTLALQDMDGCTLWRLARAQDAHRVAISLDCYCSPGPDTLQQLRPSGV